MKKISIGLLLLGMLAGPALAQKHGGAQAQQPTPEELEKKRDAEALDQQYKNTLKRTNADRSATRVDPWANMRSGPEPKH